MKKYTFTATEDKNGMVSISSEGCGFTTLEIIGLLQARTLSACGAAFEDASVETEDNP